MSKRTDHTVVDWDEGEDGFRVAECRCGWKLEGLPDLETTIDALCDHVWNKAFQAGQQDNP